MRWMTQNRTLELMGLAALVGSAGPYPPHPPRATLSHGAPHSQTERLCLSPAPTAGTRKTDNPRSGEVLTEEHRFDANRCAFRVGGRRLRRGDPGYSRCSLRIRRQHQEVPAPTQKQPSDQPHACLCVRCRALRIRLGQRHKARRVRITGQTAAKGTISWKTHAGAWAKSMTMAWSPSERGGLFWLCSFGSALLALLFAICPTPFPRSVSSYWWACLSDTLAWDGAIEVGSCRCRKSRRNVCPVYGMVSSVYGMVPGRG